ncbi:MAG: zinc-ribbon domain containing protein [Candidatus Electryonea clarkiae]|nr:zinc-ribbon domain containing protein [Candidatus Electryonea clarkiae]MDP8285537.1 zinc-ribbon domain containing protein [Candidatus Electryonea clarkiae]
MIEQLELIQPSGEKQIKCNQCESMFIFSKKEQEFFEEMGFVTPRYCPACRRARKQEDNPNVTTRELYEIICNQCGKQSQVPFKPIEGRAVYCRDCHTKIRGSNNTDGQNRTGANNSNSSHETKPNHDQNNSQLTTIDDSERPYAELDKSVETILDGLFPNP